MSKKLLNESTIRRFAGLAGIGADVVSNFINEAYGDEEEMEEGIVSEEEEEEAEEEEVEALGAADADSGAADADADMEIPSDPDMDADADMEMDAAADMEMGAEDEGGEDAEALVSDIVAKLQDLAKMAGVDIDVEMGDEEAELDETGDEEEVMEEGEEETLEEIINGILAEESEELEELEESEESEEMEEGRKERPTNRRNKPITLRQEQEEVVQEVLRRVRERLAQKKEQ